MKKITYLILLLILIPTFKSFAITKDASLNGKKNELPIVKIGELKLKDNKNTEDLYIRYSVANGYSMSGSTLIVNQKGEVQLETTAIRSTKKTTKKIQLTKKEFTNLKSIINDAKMFSLEDSYKCTKLCPTDMNTTSIEFHYYDKVKNISMYAPGKLPDSLSKVLKTLQALQKKTYNAK
jgi:virulence-associated protein VapD